MSDLAVRYDLKPLLSPQSVAVIGASETSFYSAMITQNLRRLGYEGQIYPINPKYAAVFGIKCYPGLSELPGPPDAVVIAVRRELVPQQLAAAEAAGARAVIMLTAGFGEAGDEEGRRLEQDLISWSRRTAIPVLGPNCLGLINVHDRVAAYTAPIRGGIMPGNIGLVMQSGGLMTGAIMPFYGRGLGLSLAVSSGNNTCVDTLDLIRYLVEDERTDVICGFFEGFRDPEKFLEVAKLAAHRAKPIVALKVGRSQQGSRATMAHTGSLSGSDGVISDVFRRHGVIRVNDFPDMLEVASVLSVHVRSRRPKGPGVGFMTASGGSTSLTSDLGEDVGLQIPDLAPETKAALARIIPPSGYVGNPCDATGQVLLQPEIYEQSVPVMLNDPNIHTLVSIQSVGFPDEDTPYHWRNLEIIANAVAGSTKPVVISTMSPLTLSDKQRGFLQSHPDLALTQGTTGTVRALKAFVEYSAFLEQRVQERSQVRMGPVSPPPAVVNEGRTLSELESRQVLDWAGVPMVPGGVARSASEAVTLAGSLGYPVVLKINSADLPHKSDVGGVALNLKSPGEVTDAYERMLARVSAAAPNARLDGAMVQQFSPGGVELFAGIAQDPQFGPYLMVGMGGIFVEILRDTALRVLPASRAEIAAMVEQLKGYPLLTGARGRKPADVGALVDALERLGAAAYALREKVSAIDINPLIVLPEGHGVLGLDALVVLS